jgi:hypothetical protein
MQHFAGICTEVETRGRYFHLLVTLLPPFLGCLVLFSAQVKGEVCIWFLGCKPLTLKMRVM